MGVSAAMHCITACADCLWPRTQLTRDCELAWFAEFLPAPPTTPRLPALALQPPARPTSPTRRAVELAAPSTTMLETEHLLAQQATPSVKAEPAIEAPLPARIDAFLRDHGTTIFMQLGVTEALSQGSLDARSRHTYQAIDKSLSFFVHRGATASPPLDHFLQDHSDYSREIYADSQLFFGDSPTDLFCLRVGSQDYLATSAPYSTAERSLYVQALWLHQCSASVSIVPMHGMWPTAMQPWRMHGAVGVQFLSETAVDLPATEAPPRPAMPAKAARWSHEARELEASLVWCAMHQADEVRPLTLLDVRHWADMSTVQSDHLTVLIDKLDAHRQAGRIAVHCMAGRGRTGTFILAHALRARLQEKPAADAVNPAAHLFLAARIQRRNVVESASQFATAVKAALP